ncbi:MAG TPA: hypothetical protein VFF81_11030 [Noviherbaspirillum sp.]|nr:hypothetical protein [Noviherbaspirillum sp.]
MEEKHSRRSVLHPGQQLHLYAPHNMTVVALQGEIVLGSPPMYIGEQLVRNTVALQEGQSHLLADSGWITIHARTRAEIACVAGTSKTCPGLGRLLLVLFLGLRRRLVPALMRD